MTRNGCDHPGVCGLMNERIDGMIFHADANSRKLRIIYFDEWLNLAEFLRANTYLRKLRVTLIVIGWT